MRLKILLLEPIYFYQLWPFEIYQTRGYFRIPSLGLFQLAAYFPKNTTVIDAIQDPRFTPKKMLKILKNYNTIDSIIGITAHSNVSALNVYYSVKFIKKNAPNATIVLGGYHATFFHSLWVKIGADIVIRNEADISYPKILNAINKWIFEDKEIASDIFLGCTFSKEWLINLQNKTKITKNNVNKENIKDWKSIFYERPIISNRTVDIMSDQPFIQNMDQIPIPQRDFSTLHLNYLPLEGDGYATTIESARGCSFNCKFCSTTKMWRGSQRFKSPEYVIKEIKQCLKYGITKFLFVDESWGVNFKRDLEFLQMLIKEHITISWIVQARIDTIYYHPELFQLAAKCGLKAALIGYENLDQKELDKCNKQTKISMFFKVRQILNEAGVLIFGFFLIDLPGENTKDIIKRVPIMYQLADVVFLQQYIPYFQNSNFGIQENQKFPLFLLDTQHLFKLFKSAEIRKKKKEITMLRAKVFLKFLLHPIRIIELIFARKPIEKTKRLVLRFYYLNLIKNILNFNPKNFLNFIRGFIRF